MNTTITDGTMTIEEHCQEIRCLTEELETQQAVLTDLLEHYQRAAEDLVEAAQQAAKQHADEFYDLLADAESFLSNIRRLELGSIPYVEQMPSADDTSAA